MPSKSDALAKAMAAVVRDMLDEGGGQAREAAARLKKDLPKLFELSRDESTLNHWTRMASTMFKRFGPVGQSMTQMIIPGLDMTRLPDLPSAISIPAKTKGEPPFFRTLTMATVGELRIAVLSRQKQLQEDTMVLNGLRMMLEHRVEQGADDDDPVFEAVEETTRPRPTPDHQPGAQA